jgi:hypothetical protein
MTKARLLVCCTLLLAGAPSGAVAQAGTVTLLDYHTGVPQGWTVRAPATTTRLAQYLTPASGGAPAAEVVVYFFGKSAGGTIEANLDRWRGQFSMPDGSKVPETVVRDSIAAGPSRAFIPVTIAEYRGTYQRGIGAGSPDSVKTGQTLVSAIVQTPRGTLTIQLFGASATVAEQRQPFVLFVMGLRE